MMWTFLLLLLFFDTWGFFCLFFSVYILKDLCYSTIPGQNAILFREQVSTIMHLLDHNHVHSFLNGVLGHEPGKELTFSAPVCPSVSLSVPFSLIQFEWSPRLSFLYAIFYLLIMTTH